MENLDSRDFSLVLVPLEQDKSNVTTSKPLEAEGRRLKRTMVAIPSPLKVFKKMKRDYSEGSKKNSESVVLNKETLAQKSSLSYVGNEEEGARRKVKETLRLFNETCRKILQEVEARPRETKSTKFRIDFEASKILKSNEKHLKPAKHIMGHVPGVEVGDEFQYRMELNILGIHKQNQGGIDYMRDKDNKPVATSIVSSGGYDDDSEYTDVLIYTGQGGNMTKGHSKENINLEYKDQEIIKGNLALANSIDKKNDVRVIRGHKKKTPKFSTDIKNYVYDGLYRVEEFWKEIGSHGKLIFKFKLRRIPGQPKLSRVTVEKLKISEVRFGLCSADISLGKERLPISAVNELDNEKPPLFTYIVKMVYPDWCRPIPPKGCNCIKHCTDSRTCACIKKNEGELPYNYDGAIVHAKTIVYECGPLCKCPPSCYLRVAQCGIKFQLQIFKTKSRGWGVRSLNSIPSGSFICEYVGELLMDKEAERLAGKDEYLFDIGQEDETNGFTIDAARKGNIGRFINHSCSPNLYAQNVLYDHEDTRIPHVMFFAMDNIPPLQELTYSYNYKIDQVYDSNGNIKKKNCYCGSSECTGRLY